MATIDPRPASANVRTSEETRVWQISSSDFDAFLESDPAIGYRIMKALAKEIDFWMPKLFGKLPRQPYTVLPIPAAQAPVEIEFDDDWE